MFCDYNWAHPWGHSGPPLSHVVVVVVVVIVRRRPGHRCAGGI